MRRILCFLHPHQKNKSALQPKMEQTYQILDPLPFHCIPDGADNKVLTEGRMIPFQKSYLGLKTLFRAHGSALPRTLLPALLSRVVAVVVVVSGLSVHLCKHIPETRVYVIFTSVTGFALVFRTQAPS